MPPKGVCWTLGFYRASNGLCRDCDDIQGLGFAKLLKSRNSFLEVKAQAFKLLKGVEGDPCLDKGHPLFRGSVKRKTPVAASGYKGITRGQEFMQFL